MIIFLRYINGRYVLRTTLLAVLLMFVLHTVEYEPIERVYRFFMAAITFDKNEMVNVDHSASLRLLPSITCIEHSDLTTLNGWTGHGVDYATSLTAGQTVSEASPAVVLDDLGRHCAKLIFAMQPKAGNITSVRIESAGLSNMTHAPVETVLCTQLPVAGVAQSDAVTIAGSEFSTPVADLKTSAAMVVLPRSAGKFQFWMNAVFNGMASAEFVADMPETLAFAPGTQYTFSLKMKGGFVQLILEVLPWSGSVMSGQDNFGAFTPVVIHIGTWEHVEIPGETGNGSTTVGTGKWRPNPELDADIGAFGLTAGGGEVLPWASEQGVPGETGGGNTDVRPGGSWGTEDVPGSSGGGNTNIGSGNSWGTENVPGSSGGGNTNMSSGNSWHTEDIPANIGGDAADPASE